MQFSLIEDLREAGIVDLACDCGARFGNGYFSLEKALRHVSNWHCSDEDDLFFQAAKLRSPNPILLDGGSHAAEQ